MSNALTITVQPAGSAENGGPAADDYEEEGPKPRIPKIKVVIGFVVLVMSVVAIVLLFCLGGGGSSKEDKKREIEMEQVTESELIKDNGAKLDINPATFEQRIREETYVQEDALTTRWEDIAGQEHAKAVLREGIVWPMQNPAIFTGARRPPRGVLLFGPPGTGKTMIARAVASTLKIPFFNASGTTFSSKYYGESERLLRALFKLAREKGSAVIFLDEIDSFLGSRDNAEETEGTRRVKTEFMILMQGLATHKDRILIIAATNRPQDLDDAVLRRFSKRIQIGLPDAAGRRYLLSRCLGDVPHNVQEADWMRISEAFEGKAASASDLTAVCEYAAMQPVRKLIRSGADIAHISPLDVPPVTLQDFVDAIAVVKPSIRVESLKELDDWEMKHSSL